MIDTESKRRSVLAYMGCLVLPRADGTVGAEDRPHAAWLYSGLAYGPAVEPPIQRRGGSSLAYMRWLWRRRRKLRGELRHYRLDRDDLIGRIAEARREHEKEPVAEPQSKPEQPAAKTTARRKKAARATPSDRADRRFARNVAAMEWRLSEIRARMSIAALEQQRIEDEIRRLEEDDMIVILLLTA